MCSLNDTDMRVKTSRKARWKPTEQYHVSINVNLFFVRLFHS